MSAQHPFRLVVGTLRRRWHVVVISGLVGVCLALALAALFFPRYTAKAQVIFESSKWDNGGKGTVATAIDDAAIQSQIAAITAESHLARVLKSLVEQARAETNDRLSRKHGRLSRKMVESLDLDELVRRVKAFKELHSRVISVTYTSKNPALAAAVTNRVVELYLLGVTEQMATERTALLNSLSGRIPIVRTDLEHAEVRLQDYRVMHGVADTNRGNTVEQLLADLTAELAVAKADLAGRQARLASHDVDNRPNGASLSDATNHSNPLSVVASADTQEIRGRVRLMEQRLAVLRDAAAEGHKPELYLRQLQQEATAARQLYEGLVQRRNELLEREILPDVRVLSPASIPLEPSSPNPILLILPSLVFACAVGGMIAVFLEQLDRGLRNEQDVETSLGLRCMGLVPRLALSRRKRSRKRGSSDPMDAVNRQTMRFLGRGVAWNQVAMEQAIRDAGPRANEVSDEMTGRIRGRPFSLYVEAIRSVVASALRICEEQGSPKVFLVTSSVAGEGKTTLATGFAVYASKLNRRVLLVDFGSRRPALSASGQALDECARQRVSLLLQNRPVADLISTIPDMGFDYMPLCRSSIDGVALIASGEVQTFLREIKKHYDFIVIDSPSILPRTEARLLASMVDKVVLAVKWGTRRDFAQNALALLRTSVGPEALKSLITTVITQVDLKRQARYHRGDIAEVLFRHPRIA